MLDCVDSIGVNLFSLFLFSLLFSLLSLSLRPAPLLRSLLLTFERSAFSPLSLYLSLSLSLLFLLSFSLSLLLFLFFHFLLTRQPFLL